MLKRHFYHSILLATALVFGACGDTIDEFSHHPCRVVIDNSLHLDATLASAMNNLSPGVFCIIRETNEKGVDYWTFSNNQNLSSKVKMSAIDLRQTRIIGLNNGVIVGFGNLDNPAVFYSYDRECPNCFDHEAVPIKSKPLSIDEKGWAKCNVCKRVYNLNNRGYIIEGEQGQPLTRYRGSTTGTFGVLSVY